MNRAIDPAVITGMGAVSACGIGADRLWHAARDGASGVSEIDFSEFGRQFVKTAAAIQPEDKISIEATGDKRFQDRFAMMAKMAAEEAINSAEIDTGEPMGNRCGVIVGSGIGGIETSDLNYRRLYGASGSRLDAMTVPKTMANAAASWIGMTFGITGPTLCISTACSSAAQSIGLALSMIRAGVIDRCIAGGSEALVVPGAFRAWEAMRVMTATKCRPFSEGRDGMTLGEGAGIFVLERKSAAEERGAPILAELAGYGTTSDARDLLRPDPVSAAACMKQAIDDAGLTPKDIVYVNAHGTGTVANEVSESDALRSVFGNELDRLAVSSTKPVHGHALGAAGALELIVTIKAMRSCMAPPTINFLGVDPKCGIDPVSGKARPIAAGACLSNSFAFGGINATLVVKPCPAA